MARTIVMDELHLTVRAPAGLAEARYRAMHRSLHSRRLSRRLRQAVAAVFARYRSLLQARISLSR